MNINKHTLVSDIVADNYKTAAVFKNHNIDFCCNGNRTITEVSAEKELDWEKLLSEILMTVTDTSHREDYQNWELDFMTDYIYQNHHTYVEKQIPEIQLYLNKICKVHGEKHPELLEIQTLFNESAGDLTKHMKKEELILFPFIKKIAKAKKEQTELAKPPFGSIENPINMMHHEHDDEGERFRKIAALSNNYTPPNDACNSYKVAFSLLKDFEEDLHKHIHLENNILFKRAIETEQTLNNK
ncbi:iron-sulfur cluster repair di-iron protein [Kordia sp.]|uniref:iron-sulfur cluster repair di-iron protein n=1 Tax=Kordia sp. TaxID=1965332 RepID=UPI003D6A9FD6